jgi:hypothetical protein
MRLLAGAAADVLVASQRCTNRKFRDATGWSPTYPSQREGWAAAAAQRARQEATNA